MQQARMIGYRVRKFADSQKVSIVELGEAAGCTDFQMKSFLNGRFFISFSQLSALANTLKVDVSDLLSGDEEGYSDSIVHCMNPFRNPEGRETILDIIDEYMDVLDSLESECY